MFDYVCSAPLDATIDSRQVRGGVAREELTYHGPAGGRVSATLPSTEAALPPGVVFLHWGFGNRSSFLEEARLYAAAGAMALLIDAAGMGARGRGLPRLGDANVARSFLHQCVTHLRRGIDLLTARGADPTRPINCSRASCATRSEAMPKTCCDLQRKSCSGPWA